MAKRNIKSKVKNSFRYEKKIWSVCATVFDDGLSETKLEAVPV